MRGERMKENFLKVLEAHTKRYPDMEPQDYGKLMFQSEFGAEHFAGEKEEVLSFLRREISEISKKASPRSVESIGGGLCRFPLSFLQEDYEVKLAADLFLLTAKKRRGTKEGLMEKLHRASEIFGIGEWAAEWKKMGCPSVSHSDAYRRAYHPHYRLLQEDYAGYFAVLSEIYRLMEQNKPVIVAIDGRCGSGKSHLAELIVQLLSCNVIHMDDFYLPLSDRQENWQEIPGGNMDFARFQREILIPVREKRQVVYRPYSCGKGKITKEFPMPKRKLTVVEGSYSHHPSLAAPYDLKIFLTCSKEEQAKRLQVREGSYFEMFEKRWIPMEENYFLSCGTKEGSDFVTDTEGFF